MKTLILLAATALTVQTAFAQSPSPSPSPLWSELAETRSCPESDCPAGRGFTVQQDGDYRSGRGSEGNITSEELQRLIPAGNAVASQDLTGALACDASGAEAGVNVTLKKGEQNPVVYEGKPDGALCHRGETGSVIALKNELDGLAQKYDRGQVTIPVVNVCAGRPDGFQCDIKNPAYCDDGTLVAGENYECKSGQCVYAGSFAGICPPGPTDFPEPTLPPEP